MYNMCKIILTTALAILLGTCLIFAQEYFSSSPGPSGDFSSSKSPDYHGETDDELYQQCVYLNSIRANFSICCEYPQMVIWRWQAEECEAKCESYGRSRQRCCLLPCCFAAIGMFHLTQTDDGTITEAVFDLQGLIFSFLLSVGNDSAWLPVISGSTTRCYDQFGTNDEGFDCDVIPRSIYYVFDCSYNENYLKCANWNPYQLPECDYTYQFVEKCMVGA